MDHKLRVVERQLEEVLPQIFKCQGCTTILSGQIRQCVTGHNFCEACFNAMSSCAICRQAKTPGRNRALEEIFPFLTVNCPNPIGRYPLKKSILDVEEHEASCFLSKRRSYLEKMDESTPPMGSPEDAELDEPQFKYIRTRTIILCHVDFSRITGHSQMFTSTESFYHKKWVFRPYCKLDSFETSWCVAFCGPETRPKRCRYNLKLMISRSDNESILIDEVCTFTPESQIPTLEQFVQGPHCNFLRQYCIGTNLYFLLEIDVLP